MSRAGSGTAARSATAGKPSVDEDLRDEPNRERGLIRAEVLLVVAILAMLAAVAVPARDSEAYDLRARTDAVRQCLADLRQAIAAFHDEHGRYPVTLEEPDFVEQLEARRGVAPADPATRREPKRHDRLPPLPANPACGRRSVRTVSVMPDRPAGTEAWIYCPHTGQVRANLPDRAPDGVAWFRL